MLNRTRKTVLSFVMVMLALTLALAINNRGEAASEPAGTAKTDASQPAAMTISKDADCASCHKAYVESATNPNMLLSKHSQNCTLCHKQSDMDAAHAKATGKPKKFFRQRKYPDEMCVRCHGSYDSLVEKTKDSTVFTTTQGMAINPHDTHVGQVECYNCHKMHKDRQPIEYCFGCHHPRQLNNCKDCHAPKKE